MLKTTIFENSAKDGDLTTFCSNSLNILKYSLFVTSLSKTLMSLYSFSIDFNLSEYDSISLVSVSTRLSKFVYKWMIHKRNKKWLIQNNN